MVRFDKDITPEPTNARPGSEEKIKEMAKRRAKGIMLHAEGDETLLIELEGRGSAWESKQERGVKTYKVTGRGIEPAPIRTSDIL